MYKKILVPLDGSELAECVLPHVESIARGCGVQEVIFFYVVEPVRAPIAGSEDYAFSADEWNRMEAQSKAAAQKYLEALQSRVKFDGVTTRSEIKNGNAADGITDYADKNSIDLITIATHGRSGVSRWVMGSVADRVLRSTCVPVLMIRAPGCVPGI